MAFDNLLKVLAYEKETVSDEATQKKVLHGTVTRIGQHIKLSFRNMFRPSNSLSAAPAVPLPVTPAVPSPVRRRKGINSADHSTLDAASNNHYNNTVATPRRGDKLKVRRTTRSDADVYGDIPSVHRTASAQMVGTRRGSDVCAASSGRLSSANHIERTETVPSLLR